MRYDVALLHDNDTPSTIRYGFTASENSAAHIALAMSRESKVDMCVVEVSRNSERIVQRIRYFEDGPPLERRHGERRKSDRRKPSPQPYPVESDNG